MCHVAFRNRYKHFSWETVAVTSVVLTMLLSSTGWAQEDTRRGRGSIAEPVSPTLSVTTLNMAKEKDTERILKEWRANPKIWNSDVMLLQEVAHFAADRPSIGHTLAKEMNRHVVSAPSLANRDIDGLAIISRYPLTDVELTQLAHNDMVFHTRNRIAMAVTVHTRLGPLRVYNVHLDSRINSRTRLKRVK